MKNLLKKTDHIKCECLAFRPIMKCMQTYPVITTVLIIFFVFLTFFSLCNTIINLQNRQDFIVYIPYDNNFLLNKQFIETEEANNLSREYIEELNCHRFRDLSQIEMIGKDMLMFFKIKVFLLAASLISVLISKFAQNVGTLLRNYHQKCSNIIYVVSTAVSFFYPVIFPSQFCIKYGPKCIETSPILHIYSLEFMIQFSVAFLGFASLGFMIIMLLIASIIEAVNQQHHHHHHINHQHSQIQSEHFLESSSIHHICLAIRIVGCGPFVIIESINFVTSLWTGSALGNTLSLIALVGGYLLYNLDAASDYDKKNKKKENRQRNHQRFRDTKSNLKSKDIAQQQYLPIPTQEVKPLNSRFFKKQKMPSYSQRRSDAHQRYLIEHKEFRKL